LDQLLFLALLAGLPLLLSAAAMLLAGLIFLTLFVLARLVALLIGFLTGLLAGLLIALVALALTGILIAIHGKLLCSEPRAGNRAAENILKQDARASSRDRWIRLNPFLRKQGRMEKKEGISGNA
jgi:hypothetical protein